MSATDEELRHADDLGIDHVSYALFVSDVFLCPPYLSKGRAHRQDFSLSFLIYLVITFLVHLYQTTGRHAVQSVEQREGGAESGYAQLPQRDGPEAYELQEHEHDEMTLGSGSGDDDATKIGGEDEVDWMRREGSRVRI
jgi:hypothetical protein